MQQTVASRGSVIFVHGLAGHPFKTFQNDPSEPESLWPIWIGEDVQGIDVLSFSYPAPRFEFSDQALDLLSTARSLKLCLENELKGGTEPIVFICHSLGGLVVKRLLRLLNEQNDHSVEARDLLARVKAVVFLATPHLGSHVASLADWFRLLLRRSRAVEEMTLFRPELDDLNDWFRDWSQRPECLVFYETVAQSVLGRTVPKTTGDPKLPRVSPIAVIRDHPGIAKPLSREDGVHETVVRLLNRPGFLSEWAPKRKSKPSITKNLPTVRWQKLPIAVRLVRLLPLALFLVITLAIVAPRVIDYYWRYLCGPDNGAESLQLAIDNDDYRAVYSESCRPIQREAPVLGTSLQPILYAVANGRDQATSALLSRNVPNDSIGQVVIEDKLLCVDGGTTPLMAAAALDASKIVSQLLEAGADATLTDACGQTASLIAARNNAAQSLALIPLTQPVSLEDQPPSLLAAALEGDSSEVVAYLMEETGIRSWLGPRLESPLHLAVDAKASNSVRVITRTAPEILDQANASGITPLHLAISRGSIEIATILVEIGADIRAQTADGKTAWAMSEDRDMIGLLETMRNKLRLNARRLVNMILDSTPTSAVQSEFDLFVPANEFVEEGKDEYWTELRENVNLSNNTLSLFLSSETLGMTPLHAAVAMYDPATVEWLLQHGADPLDPNQDQVSLLELAIAAAAEPPESRRDNGEAGAAILRSIFGDNELQDENLKRQASRQMVEAVRSEPLVHQLLILGADPNLQAHPSPIEAASSIDGNSEVVRLLFENGVELGSEFDETGPNSVLAAIANRDMETLEILLNNNVNLNAAGQVEQSVGDVWIDFRGIPTTLAVCMSDEDILTKLLAENAQTEADLFDLDAFILASFLGDVEAVELIMKFREPGRRTFAASCNQHVLRALCSGNSPNAWPEHCEQEIIEQLPADGSRSTTAPVNSDPELSCLKLR